MRPSPSRGAFTLIEISVVVAILGLILLVGAFRMDGMTPTRSLETGARNLRAAIESMRDTALLRGEAGALVYDLDGRSWRLEYPPPPPDPAAPVQAAQVPERFLEGTLPDGVVFRAVLRRGLPDADKGEVRIRLTPGGACLSHAVVLGLAAGGDSARTLRVDPLTGIVSVMDTAKAFADLFEYLPDEREPATP